MRGRYYPTFAARRPHPPLPTRPRAGCASAIIAARRQAAVLPRRCSRRAC